MEQSEKPTGKGIIVGHLHLYKTDLLRALSWLDFLDESLFEQEDEETKNNLIKIINYMTRNG